MSDQILVIKHGSLGDIVSATSAFKSIRSHYAQSKIYLLTTNMYKVFLSKSQYFDKIIIDNKIKPPNYIQYFTFIKFLKKKNFKLIIDLQNSQRTMIYCLCLKFISTISWCGTRWGATIRYKYDKQNPPHIVKGLCEQLKLLGVGDNQKPNLYWLSCDISNLKISRPFFIINPGCSKNHNQKRYSNNNQAY